MSALKDHYLGDTLATYPDVPGHRGVDTSIAAAEFIKPHVSQIAQRIEDYIAGQPNGATYTEVMEGTGIKAPTVSARMRELAMKYRIVKTDTRRPTPSGCTAAVYKVRENHVAGDGASASTNHLSSTSIVGANK